MLSRLKRLYDAVDGLQKMLALLVLLSGTVLPQLAVRSKTLIYIVTFAVVASVVLAYIVTVSAYAGRGRDTALSGRRRYLWMAPVGMAIVVLTLVVLNPNFVVTFPRVAPLRELLLNVSILPNSIIAASVFAAAFGLTAAVTLSSPTLWAASIEG